ncbi:T9SS type A sorting domain-containing protein [Ulvibacter antarcticus]|uniref:Putative secreted protein (Por secretion system target) n=1 Tax=Ulvibacter antarcticus TaxID=442714 RepID=A0A3L9YD29_9FLAO|nr:T9SS type A sorting domain-containing protein [Ulvibacter antarcticus]RMA58633.1 putative secreted protein (Por secretion system target) [Ulvibacter antarcticus]
MRTSILLFVFFTVLFSYGQETKRVLFIGNSYTYYNNIPYMLSESALSTGDEIIFDKSVPGGSTFEYHASFAATRDKIMQGDWDYVVLQEQSQRPALDETFVATYVYPYANQLNNLIEAYNPCGETLFYMTWGRKNGDATYCDTWPPVCTYEGMDDLLRQRYMIMAENYEAEVSPVGAVWRYVREHHPEIELYFPDESHPYLAGSYIGAITFYTAIFRKDPTLVTFNSGLSISDATILKNAVKTVVFENMSEWFIGAYDPVASFEATNHGNLEYSFNNTSQNTTYYFWEFGDGNNSIEENPSHTYAQEGSYEVTLTAGFCGNSSQTVQTISVTLGIEDNLLSEAAFIYPNPSNEKLNVHFPTFSKENISWTILSILGKEVLSNQKDIQQNELILDISQLNSGIYFLVISQEGKRLQTMKFIKK